MFLRGVQYDRVQQRGRQAPPWDKSKQDVGCWMLVKASPHGAAKRPTMRSDSTKRRFSRITGGCNTRMRKRAREATTQRTKQNTFDYGRSTARTRRTSATFQRGCVPDSGEGF